MDPPSDASSFCFVPDYHKLAITVWKTWHAGIPHSRHNANATGLVVQAFFRWSMESAMRKITLRNAAAVVVGLAAIGAAGAAQAHDWKKKHYYYYGSPGYVFAPSGYARYYAPAPVIYAAPPPVVVYPEPMAYAPVYRPPGGINFNLNLPLR
jgi:hypothetical protein